MPIQKPSWHSLLTKINVLLQCHFSRKRLTPELESDTHVIVGQAVRLCQAMVDVISSSSWLSPALAVMELSQMVTQAVWNDDSPLRQIPHFNSTLIDRCKEMNITTIFHIIEMDDSDRSKILPKDNKHLQDIVRFCNRYPDIEVEMNVSTKESNPGDTVTVSVELKRELEGDDPLTGVIAPFFPKEKSEEWWLLVGDPKNNTLLCIKRINVDREKSIEMEFTAPEEPGEYHLKMYVMCDSYSGCDQEFDINLTVQDNMQQ